MRRAVCAAALLAALAGPPAGAASDGVSDGASGGAACVLAMARAETEARVAFETGLAGIVAGVAPDQATLAGRSRDLQVMLAQDRLDRVEYLTETRPAAFEGDAGGVPWTEADETGYMAEAAHAARMARISALGQALEADPGREGLQDLFARVVTRLFEFQSLMADHNAARRAAAAAFTACRAG